MSYATKRSFPFSEGENIAKRIKANFPDKNHYPRDKDNFTMLNRGCEINDCATDNARLVDKMMPTSFENYLGQKQLIDEGKILNNLLQRGQIPSMILWGPPGCGKASLAHVVTLAGKEIFRDKVHIVKLSATSCGIKDIKNIVKTAKNSSTYGWKTIVVMKEVHRFNKLQQDVFLPHVEHGTFILIGTTTENPSYSLNCALLSRCRIFALTKLSANDLMRILENAVQYLEGNICHLANARKISALCTAPVSKENRSVRFLIDKEAVQWLAEACDGDASIALESLELSVKTVQTKRNSSSSDKERPVIGLESIKHNLLNWNTLDVKATSQAHHMYSALCKSIRAGKENACLYWLARLMAIKEDPVYIARRLVRISSEDIGLADPDALNIAVRTMDGCQMIGMPECDVLLGQCAIYLTRAPKSRVVYDALEKAKKLVDAHLQIHSEETHGSERLVAAQFFK